MKFKTIYILIIVSLMSFQVIAYADNCSDLTGKKKQYLCYRYYNYSAGWPVYYMDLAQGVYVICKQVSSNTECSIFFKNGSSISTPNAYLAGAWAAYTNFLKNNPTFGTIE